jgi:hypothetical protein
VAEVFHHGGGFIKRAGDVQRIIAVDAVEILAVEHAQDLRVFREGPEVVDETLLVEV